MESRDSGESDCGDVLDEAEDNVGERLRTRVGGHANAGFRSMRTKGEGAAGEQGRHTDSRIEVSNGRSRKDRPRRNTNERVDGIPYRVNQRNLVCDKLHQIQGGGYTDYPPLTKNV